MVEGNQVIAKRAAPSGFRTRIPARARPFLRLVAVALVVVVADADADANADADAATSQLSRRGGALDFPIVTAMRLLSAATVLKYPLAGFVFALEVDKWDWFWLGMPDQTPEMQEIYQHWDKTVDVICLGIAAVVVLHWPDMRARLIAMTAFSWRVLGLLVYFLTDQRWLLIFFPNVFESVFLL